MSVVGGNQAVKIMPMSLGATQALNMTVSRDQSPTFIGPVWVTYLVARANPVTVARAQGALSDKTGLGAVQMEAWLGPPELGIEWTCGRGTHP